MCRTLREPHEIEQLHRTCRSSLTLGAADERGNHDVLQSGEFGQKLMKLEHEADATVAQASQTVLGKAIDTFAVDEHLAAGRRIERAHNLKQCGLAGATAADDAHQLALADGEINALKHFKRTETLVDVFQLYHWPWSG